MLSPQNAISSIMLSAQNVMYAIAMILQGSFFPDDDESNPKNRLSLMLMAVKNLAILGA